MTTMKVSDAIRFEGSREKDKPSRFALNASEKEMQGLLNYLAYRATPLERAIFVKSALTPPIAQAIPYTEMYDIFFAPISLNFGDDPKIPVEKDVIAIAFETHGDGEVFMIKPGFEFTRPTPKQWDAGIEINWNTVAMAGWNVLERAMNRATGELARQRDTTAKAAIDTAVEALSGHTSTVATTMTKASIDAIVQDAAEIGFPITKALVNPGRLMDMAVSAGWTWGSTGFQVPERIGEQLLTTLYFGNYANINWYVNANMSTSYVYFGGPESETGYHQTIGSVTAASDVDIRKKVDEHVIIDAFHAWYIGNSYRLWRLQIT